jgi:protein-disulfide isomerase/uncharacterized membrane protein
MSSKYAKTLWIVSVLAWVVAAVSLYHHLDIKMNGLMGQSFCTVNSTINCDVVALSPYAEWFGIPVAAFGMFYALLVFVIALAAGIRQNDGNTSGAQSLVRLLRLGTGLALVPTLFFASVSFLDLKAVCLLCVGTYILHLGMFLASWGWAREYKGNGKSVSLATDLGHVGQTLWISTAVLLGLHLVIPTIVGKSVSESPQITDEIVDLAVADHFSQSPVSIEAVGAATKGTPNAKITIVEFSDFQCPYCAKSAATLPPIAGLFGDDVRLVYVNFPLDPSCNSNIKGAGHALACLAAKTGLCVQQLASNDAFFAYKKQVFENQKNLSPEKISQFAKALSGADDAQLNSCVQDPKTHQIIVDQIALGARLGIQGTPSIFVNGRKVLVGPDPRVLRKILARYASQP